MTGFTSAQWFEPRTTAAVTATNMMADPNARERSNVSGFIDLSF
jgi:hypothetical protein